VLLLLCCLAAMPAWAQSLPAKTYTLDTFDSIEILGSAVVRFTQGPVDQITLEGGDETHKSIDLQVQGGKLSIRSSGAWKFWSSRQLQLAITARQLRRVVISGAGSFHAPALVQGEQISIAISGSGSVRFDQLKADALKFGVSGAGAGAASGQVRELGISIAGKGKFNGEMLASETTKVAISGVGDAAVWSTRELSIAVAGAGNIDYWGLPQVKRSISGSADIQHHGDKSAPP
jgi:Putative auto-transporter adhesin, head GIN domain